ncbi:Ulp2p [Sugiyamaella lignohabitans]|uniref:Ulp2p n=1 Tax=Sugiyamaella lignohabitans TaxID=796027 RepID=A0A167EIF3_9ASCO|nr:Ulp2p [Sugiyamaella lignohabitans]ANB14122.1 Ulp2p [Sugiyamaella lignohabitans]
MLQKNISDAGLPSKKRKESEGSLLMGSNSSRDRLVPKRKGSNHHSDRSMMGVLSAVGGGSSSSASSANGGGHGSKLVSSSFSDRLGSKSTSRDHEQDRRNGVHDTARDKARDGGRNNTRDINNGRDWTRAQVFGILEHQKNDLLPKNRSLLSDVPSKKSLASATSQTLALPTQASLISSSRPRTSMPILGAGLSAKDQKVGIAICQLGPFELDATTLHIRTTRSQQANGNSSQVGYQWIVELSPSGALKYPGLDINALSVIDEKNFEQVKYHVLTDILVQDRIDVLLEFRHPLVLRFKGSDLSIDRYFLQLTKKEGNCAPISFMSELKSRRAHVVQGNKVQIDNALKAMRVDLPGRDLLEGLKYGRGRMVATPTSEGANDLLKPAVSDRKSGSVFDVSGSASKNSKGGSGESRQSMGVLPSSSPSRNPNTSVHGRSETRTPLTISENNPGESVSDDSAGISAKTPVKTSTKSIYSAADTPRSLRQGGSSRSVTPQLAVDGEEHNSSRTATPESTQVVSTPGNSRDGARESTPENTPESSRTPKLLSLAARVAKLSLRGTFCYQFPDKKSVDVTEADYRSLDSNSFLNDTILNLFLRMALFDSMKSDPAIANSTHLFNSFFYDKLGEKKDEYGRPSYEVAMRWTSKVDLFSKKYVILPINEAMHWYVAIIYNLPSLLKKPGDSDSQAVASPSSDVVMGEAVDSPDSSLGSVGGSLNSKAVSASPEPGQSGDDYSTTQVRSLRYRSVRTITPASRTRSRVINIDDDDGPVIFILDSLKTSQFRNNQVSRKVKDYIVAEAKARYNITVNKETIRSKSASVPQQDNYCDCGIYVIHYIEQFLSNPQMFIRLMASATDAAKKELQVAWEADKIKNKRAKLKLKTLNLEAITRGEHVPPKVLELTKESDELASPNAVGSGAGDEDGADSDEDMITDLKDVQPQLTTTTPSSPTRAATVSRASSRPGTPSHTNNSSSPAHKSSLVQDTVTNSKPTKAGSSSASTLIDVSGHDVDILPKSSLNFSKTNGASETKSRSALASLSLEETDPFTSDTGKSHENNDSGSHLDSINNSDEKNNSHDDDDDDDDDILVVSAERIKHPNATRKSNRIASRLI